MGEFVEWSSLANIVVMGVLIGAGLPSLFAFGVRVMHSETSRERLSLRARRIIAFTCFGIVVLAILGAIAYLASGGH